MDHDETQEAAAPAFGRMSPKKVKTAGQKRGNGWTRVPRDADASSDDDVVSPQRLSNLPVNSRPGASKPHISHSERFAATRLRTPPAPANVYQERESTKPLFARQGSFTPREIPRVSAVGGPAPPDTFGHPALPPSAGKPVAAASIPKQPWHLMLQ